MQLKHFISETLSQLIDGVVEAQKKVQASGGRVSPHVHTPNDPKSLYGRTNDKLPVIFVDFDISVERRNWDKGRHRCCDWNVQSRLIRGKQREQTINKQDQVQYSGCPSTSGIRVTR